MKKLLKNGNLLNSEINKIIEDVVYACDTCTRFKKPPPRPIVGLPKSLEFNDVVSVDLHYIKQDLYYLHVTDEFTRYSQAAIMKRKSESAKVFLCSWIGIFGVPRKVFSDNGGEFIGEDFIELCEIFNIKVSTTASHSPWSNGTCERHNQFITNMLHKIRDDTKCSYETALAWAISTKNGLINNNGFSPAQLVFGRNCILPNTLVDHYPAPDKTVYSSDLASHIYALNSARQVFVALESSSKIKLSVKKNIRNYQQFYNIGNMVYYKRDSSHEWKGLAKVLGQDGAVSFSVTVQNTSKLTFVAFN